MAVRVALAFACVAAVSASRRTYDLGGPSALSPWRFQLQPTEPGAIDAPFSREVIPKAGDLPPPPPCADAGCAPGTDDSTFRVVTIPHDFVVEGNFSKAADMSHGYLPYGVAYYRRHFALPADARQTDTFLFEFEGVMVHSQVWLNGVGIAAHDSGYTSFTAVVPGSVFKFGGADNVLALRVDATNPDGWWYDGGGVYRPVKLVIVSTPGPRIATWGVYAPSFPLGNISWAGGAPFADSTLLPTVEVVSNASSATAFSLTLTVTDATGAVVATTGGSGSVPANGAVIWAAPAVTMPNAALWHLVAPPLKPALYRLATTLTVGGVAVDAVNVTFGVRSALFNADRGFALNGVPVKIAGSANHQDFAAVGVAVPAHIQWYRVQKMKDMNGNGWRTAHNTPTPALLDACDELGMVVWDENHRNGQFDEVPALIKRDRNHPSVVIWSICNEVLCNTSPGDWIAIAKQMRTLMHSLDPTFGRPVSANQNGWHGPTTPLDVIGIDYSTQSYDSTHAQTPTIPLISSETSSAVSDRGEYASNAAAGHVDGYDDTAPGWGETAEGAWGGIGQSNAQGVFTRDFIAGGWTWTAWDYRGEPTPYSWPDVNSHFGILDAAGFEKDRYFWYKSHNPPYFTPNPPAAPVVLHLFPHWTWPAGTNVKVWAFSNAQEVELFVNGVSAGRKPSPTWGHVEWDAVPFAAGSITAVGYNAGAPVATAFRNTTGAPARLAISIKDGVGATLMAGCDDAALVQVAVLDAAGLLVDAAPVVTFSMTGNAQFAGTANGDPAGLYNNKSPARPAYHGLVLGVVLAGPSPSSIVVTASAPGLAPVSITIPQVSPPASFAAPWCPPSGTI